MASEVDFTTDAARHLSLEPPVATFSSKRAARQSTLESADQAAGIFSLYGDPASRESWQSEASTSGAHAEDDHHGVSRNGVSIGHIGQHVSEPSNGYRNSTLRDSVVADRNTASPNTADHEDLIEEVPLSAPTSPPLSPRSWEGPMSELNGSRFSAQQQTQLPLPKTPNIKVTPERKLTSTNHSSSNRNSLLGSTTSSAVTTPTHRSVQRLSPHPLGSSVNSVASSNGSIGQNGSQVSVAGSSQYPGEEADAFHVRSTCEFTRSALKSWTQS
jgi:hypothetical protein